MIEIQASKITEAVYELILYSSYHLPNDVREALHNAILKEEKELPKYILGECIRNYKVSEKGEYPLCQDTGTAMFFVEVGEEVYVNGNITEAINQAVSKSYNDGYLRKSQVNDPVFDRVNTKDNTPAVIHYEIVKGDKIKINFLAKGGGAENCSELKMLTPSDGADGIINFVVEAVKRAGGKPCPPIILGIGIGSTSDQVMVLSKKALLKKTGERNLDPRYAELEKKILSLINSHNIGAQGLGGKTTAFDVHIEAAPCHIASMPVGITINCHSSRHDMVVIDKNKIIFERSELYNKDLDLSLNISNIKKINTPLSVEDVLQLKAGNIVSLTGTIYTARDAAHKRLSEAIASGEKLPFDMEGQCIYYAGPSPSRPGKPIGSCGPTTSYRMDSFSEQILKQGIRIMIGKGPRTAKTIELMQEYPCVYLANIGGAAAVTAEKILSSELIAYEDLGPEAIRKLKVEDFVCVVAVDSYGKNLYECDDKKNKPDKMHRKVIDR